MISKNKRINIIHRPVTPIDITNIFNSTVKILESHQFIFSSAGSLDCKYKDASYTFFWDRTKKTWPELAVNIPDSAKLDSFGFLIHATNQDDISQVVSIQIYLMNLGTECFQVYVSGDSLSSVETLLDNIASSIIIAQKDKFSSANNLKDKPSSIQIEPTKREIERLHKEAEENKKYSWIRDLIMLLLGALITFLLGKFFP